MNNIYISLSVICCSLSVIIFCISQFFINRLLKLINMRLSKLEVRTILLENKNKIPEYLITGNICSKKSVKPNYINEEN
jgi:hypothetical protein